MANKRSQNWISQQRVDTPHLRSIESATRNDFDDLLNSLVTGEGESYVLRGFEINMTQAINNAATGLQLVVSEGSIFHQNSNSSGTFFVVESGTINETLNSTINPKIEGSFTFSSLNYIGIELERAIDDSTTGQVYLWQPTVKNEITKTIPLAETLNYKIVITSSVFADNVLPIAIVETNDSNNVVSIQDRRPMLFRLGTAGSSTPDPFYKYPWNDGRSENHWSTVDDAFDPFYGGDKQIKNLKEWMDAVMSSFQEIKGTTFWYGENTGGSLVKIRTDLANLKMTGSGYIEHNESAAGQVNWSDDIYLDLISSRLRYKIDAYGSGLDLKLDDDQVAYIKIVRGQDITPSLVFINNEKTVVSVGEVPWTNDVIVGDWIKVGSKDDTEYYQIGSIFNDNKVELTEKYQGVGTGISGTDAKYAYGSYQVVPAHSTDRHIKIEYRKNVPFDEDVYWLLYRSDNGGTAKIYLRGGGGGELEQGERREISDNQTLDVLEYMGSQFEGDSTPDYTNSVITGVAEISEFTFPAASALTTGQSFYFNSSGDLNQYYAWINITDIAGGEDPSTPGKIPIEIAITAADSNGTVASVFETAIAGLGLFNVSRVGNIVTAKNTQVGQTTNAVDDDMGAGFVISTTQEGAGTFNRVVVDEENLTKSIKRLDTQIGGILIDTPNYAEKVTVVASGAGTNELNNPVAISTVITIPKNTIDANVQQLYTVGAKTLEVFLNGVQQHIGIDYNEVGSTGSTSYTIEILKELITDDLLYFTINASGTGSGGGGGSYTGSNLGTAQDANVFKQLAGTEFQYRRLAAGANISITEDADKITFAAVAGVAPSTVQTILGANYTALSTDDVILVENQSADRTVTLPDATASSGKVYDIKKLDAGNTLFIKSILGQTLDGVNIDASPHAVNIQYESMTIVSDGSSWWLI